MNDDISCSYYLHHGDSPGTILVSQLLVGDNYPTWPHSMEMTLSAKNKIGLIDGSIVKPDTSDSHFRIWLLSNNSVISWILNSISKELTASLIYIETTKEMQSNLKDHFSQGNGLHIFQLQKAISSLSQDQTQISLYFTKLKGLWDELINYKPIPACSYRAMKVLLDFSSKSML